MVAFIDQLFWGVWFSVVYLLIFGYLVYVAGALIVGGIQNPKVVLIIGSIIGLLYVMPIEVSLLVIGITMIARIAWVVRDWLSEPVYAPQRQIKVRVAR